MLVRDELRRGGVESQIPAGIVLTGGGAQLRGLCEARRTDFQSAGARGVAARACRHERRSFPARVCSSRWIGALRRADAARCGESSQRLGGQVEKYVCRGAIGNGFSI